MKADCKALVLLVLLQTACLHGCTSIPLASMQEDMRVKSAAVRPDKAHIYVYRHQTLGFAVPMTVAVDGRTSGRTVAQTYVMWEVDPGLHEITSYAEDTSALSVDAQPGKAYFIWQEVKLGLWKARSRLHRVDEETGRKFVAECRLGQV